MTIHHLQDAVHVWSDTDLLAAQDIIHGETITRKTLNLREIRARARRFKAEMRQCKRDLNIAIGRKVWNGDPVAQSARIKASWAARRRPTVG